MITHDELISLLDYDADTGLFYWKIARNRMITVGQIAGNIHNTRGYVQININKKNYYGHRLAWFYINREWPKRSLDHIDKDKSNNCISNLRLCDHKENGLNRKISKNNTSGHNGIYYRDKLKKWIASRIVEKKRIWIGTFDTKDEAIEAHRKAMIALDHPFITV